MKCSDDATNNQDQLHIRKSSYELAIVLFMCMFACLFCVCAPRVF